MTNDDLIAELTAIEETLRDRALDALREAVEVGDTASPTEKQLTRARRSVAKAIEILSA